MLDPTVGIWMTEDPLGFDAGDPNLRRYVGNNATNGVDRNGLQFPPALPSGPLPSMLPGPFGHDAKTFKELVEHLVPNDKKTQGGYGQLYWHSDAVWITCKNADDAKALASAIYEDMKLFKQFSDGNLFSVKLFGLPNTDKYAGFTLAKDVGAVFGDGLPMVGGPIDHMQRYAFVKLKYKEESMEIFAQTVGAHPLVGVRRWQVKIDKQKANEVIVQTDAYDRRYGLVADKGFKLRGAEETVQVWEKYLDNIVRQHAGACVTTKPVPVRSYFVETPEATADPKQRRTNPYDRYFKE